MKFREYVWKAGCFRESDCQNILEKVTVMVLVFQHLLYFSALTFFIPRELLLVVFPNRGLELLETL